MTRLSAKKRHRRVEVAWADSVATSRWTEITEVMKQRGLTRIVSVGFVLADDKRGLVLASSLHGNEAAGVAHIPRSAILAVRTVAPR